MRIHETFTKKDLVKIIQDNKININIKLTRYDIIKELIKYIDKYELNYLTQENQNKKLTVKEKTEIIVKAQQIISLHKNGYNYQYGCYKDKENLLKECDHIKKYGDISSVRRAIKFVNNFHGLNIQCDLSNDMVDKLDHKETLKKNSTPKITFVYKKCIVNFD
tara:strand:+ start:1580 stop:2068 length:489 start_codon:yes stop_codon:yes gene_type:complete